MRLSNDLEIEKTVRDLESNGVAVIRNFFSDEAMDVAQDYVKRQISKNGLRYFSLMNVNKLPDSPFENIIATSGLDHKLSNLVNAVFPSAGKDTIYNVLRILAGETGAGQSYRFHYDASIITALMPLYIPDGEPRASGDLIVFPNLRSIRNSVIFNVIEKIFLQNRCASLLFRREFFQRWLGGKRIKLKPRDLYLFWGYRTFHGNEPCATDQMRATALFHLGNPHRDSSATSFILKIRGLRNRINLRHHA